MPAQDAQSFKERGVKTMTSTSFKKIIDYTPEELDLSIAKAIDHCKAHDLDFYKILNGIDAYMERRARKRSADSPTGQELKTALEQSMQQETCAHTWQQITYHSNGMPTSYMCKICGKTASTPL